MTNKLLSFFRGNGSAPERGPGRTPLVHLFNNGLRNASAGEAPDQQTSDWLDDEQQLADDMRSLSLQLERMNECRGRLAAAKAPVERLTAALAESEAGLNSTDADLARLDAEERETMEVWAQTGAGDRPAPRARRRLELERAVEDAKRSLANVEAALSAKKAALVPLEEELGSLAIRRDAIVVNVLCDQAEILGRRYKAALEEVVRHGRELRALNMCLTEVFGHVTLHRPDAPLYASTLRPPAIERKREPLFAEMRLTAEGFYLRALSYRDVEAVATTEDVLASVGRWVIYAKALMGINPGGDDQAVTNELASLVAENADLREKLAGSEPPQCVTGVEP